MGLGIHKSEEVEVRLQPLVRFEHVATNCDTIIGTQPHLSQKPSITCMQNDAARTHTVTQATTPHHLHMVHAYIGRLLVEVRVRTSGPGSSMALNLDPCKGSGLAVCMNLDLNLGSGSCVNPVHGVREPDHGQSTYLPPFLSYF